MPSDLHASVELRTARYDSLVILSEALRACHDRETLFRGLARSLHRVVPFNVLGLALIDEQTRAVASYVLETSGEAVTPLFVSSGEQLSIDDLRGQQMQSICSLPLVTARREVGMLILGSHEPHTYDSEEVPFLSLVANQVALAIDDTLNYEALQQALALERERAENLVTSDELLRALSTVLDVRGVFARVSQIVGKVLPHDRMTMAFHDREGEAIIQAATDQSLAPDDRVRFGAGYPCEPDSFVIFDDLQRETFEVLEPADFWDRVGTAGFRSLLLVRRQVRDQQFGLGFWSSRAHAFDRRDVPIAQRVADHVAWAISHEQLAEADRQVAEARARADQLEARVRSLTRELTARTGHPRVV